jgi:hypothetical protein
LIGVLSLAGCVARPLDDGVYDPPTSDLSLACPPTEPTISACTLGPDGQTPRCQYADDDCVWTCQQLPFGTFWECD